MTKRQVLVAILLSLGVACAFTLSSSSTIDLALASGVSSKIVWSAVGLLEIMVLTGTYIWVTTADSHLKWWCFAAVAMSSGVTLSGGVKAYGWFGAVAPIGLIMTVHIVAMVWNEKVTKPNLAKADKKKRFWQKSEPEPEIVQITAGDTFEATDQAVPSDEPPTQPEPVVQTTKPTPEGTKTWSVDDIIADVGKLGGTDNVNQRFVRNTYGVGATKANQVLEAVNGTRK